MARRSIPGQQKIKRTSSSVDRINEAQRALRQEIALANRQRFPIRDHGTQITEAKHVTKKTPSCLEEIFQRISCGESLTNICKDEHLPNYRTVWSWIYTDPEVRERYENAKKAQMDFFTEQILDIADESETDIMLAYDKSGRRLPMVNYENIKRSELRVKARMWMMERLKASKFNEKVLSEAAAAERGQVTGQVQATIQIMLPDNGRKILDVTPIEG